MSSIRPLLLRNLVRPNRANSLSLSWCQKRCATVQHKRKTGRPKGAKGLLTNERLAFSDKYPLAAELYKAIRDRHPKKGKTVKRGPKAGSTHLRTQVVSPDLCDDILKYYGPFLEQYKGCDVLDINPGGCLWSQKLHEFLKPRSHILLEPSPDIFGEFINPLLEAPESTYRLVVKDPTSVDTYREIIDEGLFPHQKRVDVSEDGARAVNNTLLVTGQLAWDPRLPGMGFDSMAKQLYHLFASAAWKDNLFYALGPIRSLLWFQHDDFNPCIAQAASGMAKANCHLEMTHNVEMVVGAERKGRPVGRGSVSREPQYELESLVRALRVGRAAGMEPPPHRRDFSFDFAKHIEKTTQGTGIIKCAALQEYVHEQQMNGVVPVGLLPESFIQSTETEINLRKEHPDLPIEDLKSRFHTTKKTAKTNAPGHPAEEDFREFKKMRATMTSTIRTKLRVEEVADVGELLYVAESKALQAIDESEKSALFKQVQNLDNLWEEKMAAIDGNYRAAPAAEVDDRLSLRYPPHPRIQWDQRAFEPLIAYDKEFWPQNRMTLISTIPKIKPADLSSDWYEWLQDIIYGLYREPGLSVDVALETMQHGLSDIMKECPSLTDPKVGGRLQMKHLRVRMLTREMLTELVDAYLDWPFKAPGSDHNKHFRHKGGIPTA